MLFGSCVQLFPPLPLDAPEVLFEPPEPPELAEADPPLTWLAARSTAWVNTYVGTEN